MSSKCMLALIVFSYIASAALILAGIGFLSYSVHWYTVDKAPRWIPYIIIDCANTLTGVFLLIGNIVRHKMYMDSEAEQVAKTRERELRGLP